MTLLPISGSVFEEYAETTCVLSAAACVKPMASAGWKT